MARYIDADKKIHIQIFDEEHEEYIVLEQTIAECLDSYTDEGCPEPIVLKRCDTSKRSITNEEKE